jgi:hypothetical protein
MGAPPWGEKPWSPTPCFSNHPLAHPRSQPARRKTNRKTGRREGGAVGRPKAFPSSCLPVISPLNSR